MKTAATKSKRTDNRLGSGELVRRAWNRVLWAVEMRSMSCRPEGMIIGDSWHAVTPEKYAGEPSRALLFRTRSMARKWCAAKTIDCKRHSPDWKFKPVRVRETLQPNIGHEPRAGESPSASSAL